MGLYAGINANINQSLSQALGGNWNGTNFNYQNKGLNTLSNALTNLGNQMASYQSKANAISAQAAREAMAHSSAEAALNRQWQEQMLANQYAYNSAEAEKNRNWNSAEAQISRDFTSQMWDKTTAYNSAEAQKNRDWQTEMSNTAVQRQVKDMIEAGINPILAAQYSGASVGSGATASTGTPSSAQAAGGATASGGTAGGGQGQGFSYQGQISSTGEMINLLGMAIAGIGNIMGNTSSTKVGTNASKLAGNLGGIIEKFLE